EVNADRNSDIHYSLRARYVCPFSTIGYKVSFTYRLVEEIHEDWNKERAENDTIHSCTFTLSVYDVKAVRLTPGTVDETIDLKFANQFFEKNNITISIIRGDDWQRPASNETMNPTFTFAPIDTRGMHYSTIFEAFANMTNLYSVAR
ncbi:hypothetical protein PENTCL1PPCAC_29667, partial [Pristionchus entomophagus]